MHQQATPGKKGRGRQTARAKKRGRRIASLAASAAMVAAFGLLSWLGGDALWEFAAPPPEDMAFLLPTATAAASAAPAAAPFSGESGPPAETPPGTTDIALVWASASGSRYHANGTCSGMKSAAPLSIDQALDQGLTACQRCKPPE